MSQGQHLGAEPQLLGALVILLKKILKTFERNFCTFLDHLKESNC